VFISVLDKYHLNCAASAPQISKLPSRTPELAQRQDRKLRERGVMVRALLLCRRVTKRN
jgi:hypothetical protein